MREGGLGAEVRDGQRRFEGTARRQDLSPDGADRLTPQRPRAGCPQPPENFGLTVRGIDWRILPSFEVSDLEDGLGALVEELEDSVVEVVDPGTPIVQVHRNSHCCLTRIIADYRLRPPVRASHVRSPPGSAATAARSAFTSRAVRGRHWPGRSAPRATGPNEIRRSAVTRWPSASQKRLTSCLRPSANVSRRRLSRGPLPWSATSTGRAGPSSRVTPRRHRSRSLDSTVPSTTAS